MAKGIRPAVNAKFQELAPQLMAGEFGAIEPTYLADGYTNFRASVMQYAIDTFLISLSSASTHYTHIKNLVCVYGPEHPKHNPTFWNPDSVGLLGRPEDKKGGRPAGSKNNTVGTEVAVQTELPAGEAEFVAAIHAAGEAAAQEEAAPAAVVEEVTVVETPAEVVAETVALYDVVREKDSVLVAENLTLEAAQELIDKAKAAKKAKLVMQEA
jgi:hypothetical protein